MTPEGDAGPVVVTACYRHPKREAVVRCVRCDRYICPECMRDAAVGFQCPECVSAGQVRAHRPRTVYGGRMRTGALVTWVLVGINVAVFIATAIGGTNLGLSLSGSADTSPLYRNFELVPYFVAQGGYYRLVTAMFLHYGILHILFNMWALVYVGPPLEAALGRIRFAALYLLAGIGGSVATYAFGPVFEASAGASGAIFGLFAAYFVFARHQRRDTRMITALIVLNLIFSFSVPGIDIRAHVGGLLTGAVVGAVLAYAPPGRRRALTQGLGSVLVGLILVAGTAVRTHDLHASPPVIGSAQAPHAAQAGRAAPAALTTQAQAGRAASTAATTSAAVTPSRNAETT